MLLKAQGITLQCTQMNSKIVKGDYWSWIMVSKWGIIEFSWLFRFWISKL